MNVFISGGCKNGKSHFAQRLAKEMADKQPGTPLYYLATMNPRDEEDRRRIARHISEREGWGFETLECSKGIAGCLEHADKKGVFLLDSVTALLSNEMFPEEGNVDYAATERIARELTDFAKNTGAVIFVSDYIYSDAVEFQRLTDLYRRGLAYIDRTLAEICEQVYEVTMGIPVRIK